MADATAANSTTVHASAVLVGARAVLIRGPSGAGKSRLALDLIEAARAGALLFARLVGDDRVHLEPIGGRLLVRPGRGAGRPDRSARRRHVAARSRAGRRGRILWSILPLPTPNACPKHRKSDGDRRYLTTAACGRSRYGALAGGAGLHQVISLTRGFEPGLATARGQSGWKLVNHNDRRL